MRNALALTFLAAALIGVAPSSHAQSLAPSDASLAASAAVGASATVVAGSALLAGSFVVVAIQAAGDATVFVLRSVASGAETTVRVAGRIASDLAVVPGTVMLAVAQNTGVDLTVQGRVAAYVPNQAGAALVHSSRVSNY
jgi:hypothetical protein